MRVTENGPAGYDYQYLASFYLILHYWRSGGLDAVFIDRLGSEDLTLETVDKAGQRKVIESQFKNRGSAFDDGIFYDCITKFPAMQGDQNILSLLQQKRTGHFYILTSAVVAGLPARLPIAAVPYSFVKSNGKTPKADLQLFIDGFPDPYPNAVTNLQRTRKAFLSAQKTALTTAMVEDLLHNITLIDRLTKNELIHLIGNYLTELSVPVSAQRQVMLEYLELVKEKRGTSHNMLADLQRLLLANTKNFPALDKDYYDRGNEAALLTRLQTEQVLLLTGVPLCGKSQAALKIASVLMEQDPTIEYQATTDVRAAEVFLYSQAVGARLCYLEDPTTNDGTTAAHAKYRLLESLIFNLPKGKQRYLMVTAPVAETAQLRSAGYLADQHWQDLSDPDPVFLQGLWERLKVSRSVPAKINALIKKLMSKGPEQVQSGQLVYLSRNFQRLDPVNEETLAHFINFRSSSIKEALINEAAEIVDAMQLIAAVCDTQNGITDADLQFFCDPRPDHWPGINAERSGFSTGIIYGSRAAKVYRLKVYENLPDPDPAIESALSKLMDYGYIEYQQGHYQFRHPIYREAGRALLTAVNPIRFKKTVKYLTKGIACLNRDVALRSARNLLLVADPCTDKDIRALIAIAAKGIHSTFMSVRDQSLLFLIGQFDRLDKALQEKVAVEIQKRSLSQSDSYVWQDDIAFVPDERHLDRSGPENYYSKKWVSAHWKRFLNSDTLPDAHEAADLVRGIYRLSRFRKGKLKYPVRSLLRFLSYDESFIRGRAAYLLAASADEGTIDLVKELFEEGDPLVNYHLIKGLIRCWPYLRSPVVKNELKVFMVRSFDNLFIVIAAIDLFTQFSAGHTQYTFDWMYEIEERIVPDLWLLWGELMPVFFKHLPPAAHINTNRFAETLRQKEVPDAALDGILSGFVSWLSRHIAHYGYQTSMAEIPVWLFANKVAVLSPVVRFQIIKDLFAIGNQVLTATMWRYILMQWDQLSKAEKSYLLKRAAAAEQLHQAVILTTGNIDSAFQTAIAGKVFTDGSPDEAIKEIPQPLLLASLATLYLLPPFYDYPGRFTGYWNKVLGALLQMPEHEGFAIAVTVFFNDVLVMRSTRDGLWHNPRELYRTLLRSSTAESRQTLFTKLLLDLMANRHSKAKVYLDELLDHAAVEELGSFEQDVVANVIAIAHYENLSQVPDRFASAVNKELSLDYMTIKMFGDNWIADMEDSVRDGTAKLTVYSLQQNAIKTPLAIKVFDRWSQEHRELFTTEELATIEGYLSKLHELSGHMTMIMENAYEQRFRDLAGSY